MHAGVRRNRSPLRGRYLVRNPLLVGALGVVDGLLAAGTRRLRAPDPPVTAPRRVLLSVGGHLGDAVIASSVLPLLRTVWPGAEVGILTGSWSRAVFHGHPGVRRVHTLDHWKLDRSGAGPLGRLRRYAATRRQALREITEVGYDVAVELYPFFPNAIPLLRQAAIPVRAGYVSGGFGALLTHPLSWTDSDRHVAEHHRDLLSALDPRFARAAELRCSLPPRHPASAPPAGLAPGGYLVLHMGAGLALKEWPREKWASLVERLLAEGHTLVFTGKGEGQAEAADRVIGGRERCHNLCDRLGWGEFVGTLAEARLVVTVDSVAGHLAAAADTPTVVLTSGMNRIAQWRPLGDAALPVSHPVPCAPCHRSRGCPAMTCVREISVEEVLDAVRGRLRLVLSA